MSLQYNIIFSKVQIQLIMLHGRTEEFSSDMLTAASGAVKATQISRVQFNDSCCTKNLMKVIFSRKILLSYQFYMFSCTAHLHTRLAPAKGFNRYEILDGPKRYKFNILQKHDGHLCNKCCANLQPNQHIDNPGNAITSVNINQLDDPSSSFCFALV